MKLRIIAAGEYLASSLWFIPLLCVIAAFVLAEIALQVDKRLDQDGAGWFLFGGGVESARTVVGTIASSMLTFTGLVFSVTMLVLQLASSQLSPRVMRTFLRDRANQIVLGVFVATYLYALMVLRRITSEAGSEPFVPALSIWFALVLVILSIGLFIYYINHMAQAIRPVTVMASVAAETSRAIDRLYPAGVGRGVDIAAASLTAPVSSIILSPGPSGVLTGVDEERVVRAAQEASCIIELIPYVGDFVRRGSSLFTIKGDWDGEAAGVLQASVSFGSERTMNQDAMFGFRQLVDIGDRALSPGINDPTTAVQVIDHLHDLLGSLAVRNIPSSLRQIEGGMFVVLPRPSWGDYVALACDELRNSGQGAIQIQRRLRTMLLDLIGFAPESRRQPLEEQIALLDGHLGSSFDGAELQRAATPSAQGQGPTPLVSQH